MALGCAICSVVVVILFAVFGYFDYTVLIGAAVGFLLAVGNFFFMSLGVIKALETGDEVTAKLKMRSSYISRTVVMLAVMAASIAIPYIHWLPVILSVFYPRIVITAKNLISAMLAKKNTADSPEVTPSESAPVPDESDDEGEGDEFEKFVSRFAKGPIPGEKGTEDSVKSENKDNKQ